MVKNSTKILKDPFRPKRPVTAFIRFYLNNRDYILKQNRYLNLLKQNRMVQIASQYWKNYMSESLEHEKDAAKIQTDQEEAKYRELMAKYQAPSQAELRRRLKEMPKRFRVNWNFYVQENFGVHYVKMRSFGEVIKVLATKWRSLSKAGRRPYDVKSRRDRRRYEKEMKKFRAKYVVKL